MIEIKCNRETTLNAVPKCENIKFLQTRIVKILDINNSLLQKGVMIIFLF